MITYLITQIHHFRNLFQGSDAKPRKRKRDPGENYKQTNFSEEGKKKSNPSVSELEFANAAPIIDADLCTMQLD